MLHRIRLNSGSIKWIIGGALVAMQFAIAGEITLAQDTPVVIAKNANKVPTFNIEQLREMGRSNSSSIKAAQLGIEGVAEKQDAINKMRFLSIISKDLPVRKQQAQSGMTAATANYSQSELDLNFSIAYTYVSIIYANQQLDVAERGINDLNTLGDIAKEIVKTGSRNDVSKKQIDQINVYLNLFNGKKEEAVQGVPRAKAALREAIGITDINWDLQTADKVLALADVQVNRESVIAEAQARRGEILQAQSAVDATCLEIKAQDKIRAFTGKTFASGSDIHANILPIASLDENYRPGAIAPEMPGNLYGSKKSRVNQAKILHERAQTVADKAKSLIVLEAENTYLRWIENRNRATSYLKSAEEAEKLAVSLKERFDPRGGKITLDEVITTGIQANTIRIAANEALYKATLALIALERVSGGGFIAPPITKK